MSIEDNKTLVADFWTAFSESRIDDALAMLSEDATWWVAGTTLLSGTYSKAEFAELLSGVGENAPKGIQVTPTAMTAEGDRVAMEADSYAEISNGRTYKNKYHFLFICRDGKIVTTREYMDTEHVTATFA